MKAQEMSFPTEKHKIRRNYFTQCANGNQMNETSFALLFFYYCSKKKSAKIKRHSIAWSMI